MRSSLLLRLFWTGLLVCVALQCVRVYWAVRCVTDEPGTALTSGWEEESLFAVYRGIHHQPVFVDPARYPYCSSYFNWLFYGAYTLVAKPAFALGGGRGLVAACRLLTFLGALVAAAALVSAARAALPSAYGRRATALAVALGIFWLAGPLQGWWTLTVRPDIWAAAFEAIALATLARGGVSRTVGSAIVAALLFYLAWSFKQSVVCGLLGGLAYLLWSRDLRRFGALVASYAFLVLLTFAVSTPSYRTAMAEVAGNNVFYIDLSVSLATNALVKLAPLLALVCVLAVTARDRTAATDNPLARELLLLGVSASFATFAGSFALSSKLGSSTNYYFSFSTALSLLAIGLLARRPAARSGPALAAFGVAALALCALPLLGHGNVSQRAQIAELTRRWTRFSQLPEPRWSSDSRLDLPWLNPASPALVLAYNYESDRQHHRGFEHGGVGRLIESGRFRTLLLPQSTGDHYDTGSLSPYRRTDSFAGMSVFVLSDSKP